MAQILWTARMDVGPLADESSDQKSTDWPVACCSTETIMSSNEKPWEVAYLRAALEVDGQQVPERIVSAREAVASRLKDLEGNPDRRLIAAD
jgi:hypothetical protein